MIKKLVSNVSWLFLANLFFAFCQWLQLSLVARISHEGTLGTYTISLAIVAPIFAFFSFQLRTIQITDTKEKWFIDDFLTFRTVANILALSVVVLFGSIFLKTYQEFIILFLLAIIKVLEGYSEVFNSKHQLDEKMRIIFISFFLKGMSSLIFFAIFLYFYGSLEIALLFSCIGIGLIVVLYDYRNVSYFIKKHKFSGKRTLEIFKTGLPLAVVLLVVALNSNISKYITEFVLGREIQGVYSTLSYFFVVGTILIGALGQGFVPRLSKLYIEKSPTFLKIGLLMLLLSIVIGGSGYLIAHLFGHFFIRLMFGDALVIYSDLFSNMMLSGVFLYVASALGYILSSMRQFRVQPYLAVILLVVGTPLSYYMISAFGLDGIPYALYTVYGMQVLLYLGAIIYNLFIYDEGVE